MSISKTYFDITVLRQLRYTVRHYVYQLGVPKKEILFFIEKEKQLLLLLSD